MTNLIHGVQIALIGLCFGLTACSEQQRPVKKVATQAPQADFYMGDVKRVIFDETGHVASRISAKTVSASRKSEMSEWEDLDYAFEREGQRWQLSAGQGRMEDNKIIRFTKKIEIKRLNRYGKTDFTLTTNALNLDLEINKLWGEAPLKITFAEGQFEGDGLVAYLDRNSLSLRNVNGHFYHD